jgi:hypothetical protein
MIHGQFGLEVQEIIRDLRLNSLNRQDAALLQKGYYEDLASVDRFNTQLWQLYTQRPNDWNITWQHVAGRYTGDFLHLEPLPSVGVFFRGAPLRTNRWGLRDKDYEKSKPPNTYRIALIGSSPEMGTGIAVEQTYQWLLEERLNRENDRVSYETYEILNFGVASYSPLQELRLFETKVLSFEPDAIFFVAHERDRQKAMGHLLGMIRLGVDIPYDFLREMARKAGIDQHTSEATAERLAKPFEPDLTSWLYQRIVENCRSRNILPVWIFLPTPEAANLPQAENADLVVRAAKAGFIVLNLSDVYGNQDLRTLWLAEWDWHPNAKGHGLIADRLYEALREHREKIPLGLPLQADNS